MKLLERNDIMGDAYTQDELNSIWQKAAGGAERYECDEVDVFEPKAVILTNTDTKQTMKITRDVGDGATSPAYTFGEQPSSIMIEQANYARIRGNKGEEWTPWKRL